VKTECRANLARLAIFYGNKTNLPFLNFQPNVTTSPTLGMNLLLQVKQVDSTVEAGAQFQQMVNVECVTDFNEQPDLHLSFYYNGVMHNVNIKLPISVNKFIEPTEMNGEAFFSRWKNLSMPSQESQKIFKAEFPMENVEATKTKLIGYGFQLLEGIDPNPDNFVCAGIIHTRAVQIGVLLRLEPNKQAEMYRLTTRSSKESVSQFISGVLCEQF
jgi:AP-2 complex subunit alpha